MSSILRVGVFNYYPMTNGNCTSLSTFRISKRCQRPGLAVEIIKLIADQANMTIQPVFFYGNDFNNLINDVFKSVENGSIDTFSSTIKETPLRRAVYAFSSPLYTGDTDLVVRRSEPSITSMYDFFTVYSPSMWLAIFASLLVFMIFGMLVHFAEWNLGLAHEVQIGDLVFRILRMQINQNHRMKFWLSSGMFALWTFSFLQCLVILNVYQSFIISSVVKFRNPRPFNPDDVVQQLRQRKYSLVSVTNFSWIYQQTHGNNSDYYDVRKTFEYNPMVIVGTDAEALELTNRGKHIIFMNEDDYSSHLISYYCDLIVMESLIPPQYRYLIFFKNYPHMNKINASIVAQSVFIQRAYLKYTKNHDRNRCGRNHPVPLKMMSYKGVIILFSVGMFTGLAALGFECLLHKVFKR